MEITTKQEKIRLIESAFGESSLANSGKNVSVSCPSCNNNSKTNSRKKKLSVCLEKGIYHCWVCEAKGKNVGSFAFNLGCIDISTRQKISEAFNIQIEESVDQEKAIFLLFWCWMYIIASDYRITALLYSILLGCILFDTTFPNFVVYKFPGGLRAIRV